VPRDDRIPRLETNCVESKNKMNRGNTMRDVSQKWIDSMPTKVCMFRDMLVSHTNRISTLITLS
jgi:hypothetical protein